MYRYGWSALHYAAVEGQFNIVELLLDRGADVRARDKDGVTAAYRAHAAGHHDVVCLMKSLADSDDLLTVQPDHDDRTSQPVYANVRKLTMTQNTTGKFHYVILRGYGSLVGTHFRLLPAKCPVTVLRRYSTILEIFLL